MLAVSAGGSVGLVSADFDSAGFGSADFSCGFSADAGLSAAVFSIMAFSEMPFALTPAAGILPVSAGLAAAFFGSAVDTAAAAGALAPGLVATI
jgi:hypothetical protein